MDCEPRKMTRLAGPTVVTEARYRCSRCGVRNDLPWLVDITPAADEERAP
jgi:hypothetical protein